MDRQAQCSGGNFLLLCGIGGRLQFLSGYVAAGLRNMGWGKAFMGVLKACFVQFSGAIAGFLCLRRGLGIGLWRHLIMGFSENFLIS